MVTELVQLAILNAVAPYAEARRLGHMQNGVVRLGNKMTLHAYFARRAWSKDQIPVDQMT